MGVDELRHLVDVVGGVGVVVGRLEGGAGVVLAAADPVEAVAAGADAGGRVLADDRVLAPFVDAALDEQLRSTAGPRSVVGVAAAKVAAPVARGALVDAAAPLAATRD